MTIDINVVLPVVGFTIWLFSLSVHLIVTLHAKFHLFRWRSKPKTKSPTPEQPGISIIKTMTSGANTQSLRNLETLFTLEYSRFEILICLPEKDTDLVEEIQKIMDKFNDVDVKLFTNACDEGVNPKVNNMLQCYSQIKYGYIWVCDSNIFVNPWTLSELASHINPDVGMVHQLPYYNVANYDFAACLEKTHFGTQHSRWYLLCDFLGICCTNGMSSIINKDHLDQTGGLEAYSCYIAEDHFIGKSCVERGLKITLSTEPALQNPDTSSVDHFVNRITRWQKLRINMVPASALEPLLECFLVGLIGVVSASMLFDISPNILYVFHIIYWFTMDQLLMYLIEDSSSSLPPFSLRVLTWLYREVITYWVFIKAVCNRKIQWRMGTFHIKYGGKASFTQASEKLA